MPAWLTAQAALGLLKRIWWSIPMALLLVALLLTRHTLAGTKGDLAACNDQRAKLEERLQTTTASLKEALDHIGESNKMVEAAGAKLQLAKQEAAASEARSNARYEPTGASVKRLEALARDKSQPACKVSESAAHALEGL
jgi:chromosome segregation ATPase